MKLAAAVAAVAIVAAACGGSSAVAGGRTQSPRPSAAAPTPVSPSPSASPATTAPTFHGTVSPIGPATRRAMIPSSWRPGCPVRIEDLRLLSLSFWGFDGKVHGGTMIVNRTVAGDVVSVFRALFAQRFPIRRMELVDAYDGNDDRSMAADNTSAFNCRAVTGGASWSQHAYGWAIDLNPLENPYVTGGGRVSPPAGARYANRSLRAKGMIHAGAAVVRAFASVGWGWGGSWSGTRDYQHFSATGR